MSRAGPGRARGILGVSRGVPGGSPGALWTSQHPPWDPSGLHFGCLFGYFFPLNFELHFFRISDGIPAPFFIIFGSQNQSRSPPGAKTSICENLCFTNVKPYFLSLGGSPGLPKSVPEATSEFKTFFNRFFIPKSPENNSKMDPKRNQNVTKIAKKI